jgi:hypothetical protein
VRIAESADWRENLAFDTPVSVAEVVPGDPTICAVCRADSDPRPRTELWAVKHRHPKNHSGYVRFYCSAHLPAVDAPPAAARPERRAPRRPAAAPEKIRAMCPDCYVEVSAKGLCGVCGNTVA